MSPFLRRTLRFTAAFSLSIVTFAGMAVSGVMVTTSQATASMPLSAGRELPTPRPSNPDGPIVVAVALGATPTVAADFLAPYEVFARSSDFLVYAVAADAAPAPLRSGPPVLPVHTFDQVTAGTAPTPDVVVVPAVQDPAGTAEQALRTFIREQSDRGARILGICAGSVVLAETGILDGLRATSHWSRISELEKRRPQVEWVRGQRYVQDGSVTTTAGITSGIPGALTVMAELAGPAEAERVGRTLNYPDWFLGGSADIPIQRFAPADAPVGLNAVVPWLRPTLGVVLSDGDSEIDIAGVLEAYNVSYAARVLAVSPSNAVTTRHGLVLLPSALGGETSLDRMVVPGIARTAEADPAILEWAAAHRVAVDAVGKSDDGNGFDAALGYLARDTDAATAESAAKMIDYPTAHLTLSRESTDWRAALLLTASVLIAIVVGLVPAAVRFAARQRTLRPSNSVGQ